MENIFQRITRSKRKESNMEQKKSLQEEIDEANASASAETLMSDGERVRDNDEGQNESDESKCENSMSLQEETETDEANASSHAETLMFDSERVSDDKRVSDEHERVSDEHERVSDDDERVSVDDDDDDDDERVSDDDERVSDEGEDESEESEYENSMSEIPDENSQIDMAAIFKELISIKSDLRQDIADLREDFKNAKSDLFGKVKTAYDNSEKALQKCDELERKNLCLQKENDSLKDRVLSLEVYSKRDNLIIEGIPQQNEENCALKVKKFFSEQLKISEDISLTRCHRTYSGQSGKNRAIICRFLYLEEREKVWAARFNLKNTRYFLKEHFPPEVLRRRSVLLPILKKAKSLEMKARIHIDKLIVESRTYTIDTLDQLPVALNTAEIATKRNDKVTAFFTIANPLSNFYPTPLLEIDGTKYANIEQYLQSQKAYFAENPQVATKIKATTYPAACKRLGDEIDVKNNQDWLAKAKSLVHKACRIKFDKDPYARKFLLDTGNTTLIEAGPDKVWGVGIKLANPDILTENSWQGTNLLGNILMAVREELKQTYQL